MPGGRVGALFGVQWEERHGTFSRGVCVRTRSLRTGMCGFDINYRQSDRPISHGGDL